MFNFYKYCNNNLRYASFLHLGEIDIESIKLQTQEEVAGAAGFDRTYMGYIERAERRPSVAILARIAKVLKVELHQFFIFD